MFLRPALLALASLLAPAGVAATAPAVPVSTALAPVGVMSHASSGTVSGQGWAGYVSRGTRFRYVQAQFKLTKLNCKKTPGTSSNQAQMADWVGLDGWPTKTVEQDGIGGFCDHGVASYSAWWETYPKPPHYIFAVHAGDEFIATVTYYHGRYRLALRDYTSGQSFAVSERCGARRCANSSAEAITEDPGKMKSKTYADYPLADCGTTEFWNIKITSQAGKKGNFSTAAWQNYQFTMTDKHHSVMMTTGTLFARGTAFQTHWKREY